MRRKDPRLVELQRQVRELVAARDAGQLGGPRGATLVLPDPIEFVLSKEYLAQRWLYPVR